MSEVSREEHQIVVETVRQHGEKMNALQDLVKSNASAIGSMRTHMEALGEGLYKKIDQINSRGQLSPAMVFAGLTFLLAIAAGILTFVTVVNKPTAAVAMRNEMELQAMRVETKQEAYNNGTRDARLEALEQHIKLIDLQGSRNLINQKVQP